MPADASHGGPQEAVSLIATLLNEADSVEAWVQTVLSQTRAPDEIVLVDAGSVDGTVEVLEAIAAGEPRLRVVVAPGLNISQGRNRAIEEAQGPLIAVTDAGTLLEQEWLERLVRPLADPAIDAVGGFFRPAGRNDFERLLAAVITPRLEEVDPAGFLPSSRSFAFRRSAWRRAGGYPPWLRTCEDLWFDMRLKDTGARFAFAPDAIVAWYPRSTLGGFYRQYRGYARGDGHARLYARRHVARYGAYTAGALLVAGATRRRWLLAPLTVGFAGYMRKFVRRVLRDRPFDGPKLAVGVALVPVVVVVGDVGKMVGYAQGRRERARAGHPEALEHADLGAHRDAAQLAWHRGGRITR